MAFEEWEYIAISGLQHFVFCKRQWALIHVEGKWNENFLTAYGRAFHDNAHQPKLEKRGNTITAKALRVSSQELGIFGECDIVEFYKNENGVRLARHRGLYVPFPVEYKLGKPKPDDSDRVQLCAQAICLEEMLGCSVAEGALFYGRNRRREQVLFTAELKQEVINICGDIRSMMRRNYTPPAKESKKCFSCSMKDECLPLFSADKISVRKYIGDAINEKIT